MYTEKNQMAAHLELFKGSLKDHQFEGVIWLKVSVAHFYCYENVWLSIHKFMLSNMEFYVYINGFTHCKF